MMNARSMLALAFVFVSVFVCGAAVAESSMDKALQQSVAKESNPAMPDTASDAVMKDPATRGQYLAAMRRFYEYRANGYAYRSRVFEWQLLSSRLIFVIVLLLVGAGIYFAAVQFHVAMVAARRDLLRDAATEGGSSLTTHFEISEKGIVVNSSVLGVIITGLSLAFFYLYLVYVYPIQNVF